MKDFELEKFKSICKGNLVVPVNLSEGNPIKAFQSVKSTLQEAGYKVHFENGTLYIQVPNIGNVFLKLDS